MNYTISVIIRCFNEKKYIEKLLRGLNSQIVNTEIEIIVVDSGSTDGTLDIINHYSTKVINISPDDFTFGHSLNKGIEAATGDICVIVSAHCFPKDESWIQQLIAPFEDHKVALVYGKQVGSETTKYSEKQIFHKWFPNTSQPVCNLAFCNNANSAIRRSVWLKHQFNEELSGLEDLDWARKVKKDDYIISYQAGAVVHHAHDESSALIFNRYYRESLAYKEIYKNEHFGFWDFLRYFILNALSDCIHSIQDKVFFINVGAIIQFRFLQFLGTYKGNSFKKPMCNDMKRHIYFPLNPLNKDECNNFCDNTTTSYIDITRPLHNKLSVWPGSKGFELKTIKGIDTDDVNESEVSFNLHMGTHIDAPFHFIKNGKSVDKIDLRKLMGKTHVLEYSGNGPLAVDFLESAKLPLNCKRLLIKTRNSHTNFNKFDPNFVAITSEGSKWLKKKGIILIGIDGPSIQPLKNTNNLVHEELLGSGIIVMEGLDLSKVVPGNYFLYSMPLKIKSAEGSPVRAILTKDML